jgi:5-enolpyruvylshikimate-3-phosphate synthase
LANKESNRASSILNMLTQMGVGARREDDELVIKGYTLVQRLLGASEFDGTSASAVPTLLKGGNYTSHHDHRMVMALKVASFGADGPVIIDDEECVKKSFPSFNEQFDRIK